MNNIKNMMTDGKFQTLSWKNGRLELANMVGFDLKCVHMLNSISPKYKIVVACWENMGDVEIMSQVTIDKFLTDELYIVTDISYMEDIIFKIKATDIERFICNYFEKYGEAFFNGDVFIIFQTSKKMLYFHHEGFWFFYDLPINHN